MIKKRSYRRLKPQHYTLEEEHRWSNTLEKYFLLRSEAQELLPETRFVKMPYRKEKATVEAFVFGRPYDFTKILSGNFVLVNIERKIRVLEKYIQKRLKEGPKQEAKYEKDRRELMSLIVEAKKYGGRHGGVVRANTVCQRALKSPAYYETLANRTAKWDKMDINKKLLRKFIRAQKKIFRENCERKARSRVRTGARR